MGLQLSTKFNHSWNLQTISHLHLYIYVIRQNLKYLCAKSNFGEWIKISTRINSIHLKLI